jgi:signal transduction histidine kinase
LAGKEYISPVNYDAQGQPVATIAVPLIKYTSGQNLSNLSTAGESQIRTPDQIFGVLIETVNLSNLWKSVLSHSDTTQGYAYVVDSQGALIGYPDESFRMSHQNLSSAEPVAAFMADPSATPRSQVLVSERGRKVMSSYAEVARTHWGVISEVPLSTIYANADDVARLGVLILTAAAVSVIILGYVASQRVTVPVKRLAAGAARLSKGELDTRIMVESRDELGTLSRTFNQMADSLATILRRAVAESTKANVILNNVNEGILALDGEGKIMLANTAAAVLVGDLPHNVINRPLDELYPWTANGQPFKPSLKEVGVYQEVTLTSLNKRVHYVDVLVNPIKEDPTGIRCILTVLDKSGERELENMKIDFVSMAAHELRTPMTSIRGYVDLIMHEDGFEPPEIIRDHLNHIESSSIQLIGLINNLLNVSRIERGALTLRQDKIDWAVVVQKSIADQQFGAKAKSIQLHYSGPADGVYLYADELAMSEVINNLLNNAINYTPDHGSVTVTVTRSDGQVVTTVADNGLGISHQSLPYLFTKFYRARSTLTSGSGGTGLGLFISRAIVEMHKGKITVASEEGKGSTFTVTLPSLDEKKYNEDTNLRSGSVTQKHGWIIKNTPRRRQY